MALFTLCKWYNRLFTYVVWISAVICFCAAQSFWLLLAGSIKTLLNKLHAGADRSKTDRDLLFSGGLKPGFRQLRNSSKLSFQSAFSSESSIRASTQRLLWDTWRDHLNIPFRTKHFHLELKIRVLFVFSIHYLANRICNSAQLCSQMFAWLYQCLNIEFFALWLILTDRWTQ